MDGRDLPGFYFDKERGKYFRIQETKDALPQAKYSQDNVRLKKRRAKRETTERKRKARQAVQQVQRASILASGSLTGLVLARESNQRPVPRSRAQDQAKAYASLLTVSFAGSTGNGVGVPVCVAFDADNDYVFHSRAHRDASPTGLGGLYCQPSSTYPARITLHDKEVPFVCFTPSIINTLNTGRELSVLGTSEPGPFPQVRVSLYKLTVPDSLVRATIGTVFQRLLDEDVTCGATNPFEDGSETSIAFAIGANSQVILLSFDPQGERAPYNFPSNVLSLDWVDAHLLAVGCRNGRVYLWDIRGNTSNFTSSRLYCSGAISNLRVANKNYIVVQRDPHVPALYDLRTATSEASKPVVEYYGAPQWDMNQGFDVHAGLGILAQADIDGCVLLHNLWTGELLRRISVGNNETELARIPYLKFIDTPRGVEILGACGGIDFKLHV